MIVEFPDCWAGTVSGSLNGERVVQYIDSNVEPGVANDLAYANASGACPAGFPFRIPQVSIHVHTLIENPATGDKAVAIGWFSQFEGAGLDGLIAKSPDVLYEPDRRVMFKIKHERTADCVVAGYRPHKSGDDAIGSLLLGLYRDDGQLASVGVVGAFPMEQRRDLRAELDPLVTTFDGHPWNWAKEEAGTRTPRSSQYSRWNVGKDLSFVPLRPERVLEVRYDHMEGPRFRHTAQFVRWRPDRSPQSCTYAQLEEPVSFALSEILQEKSVIPNERG